MNIKPEKFVGEFESIAHVQSPFGLKFATPKQSQLHDLSSLIVFAPEIPWDSISGLEDMSHLWVLFLFHQNEREKKSFMVRPPALGGNEKKGVWSTRSSFRPNGIGMSLVEIISFHQDKKAIEVQGLDCVNGTPIIDLKPFHPFADVPQGTLRCGWIEHVHRPERYEVQWNVDTTLLSNEIKKQIESILALPIEPGYHQISDNNKTYHTELLGLEICWRNEVDNHKIVRKICGINDLNNLNKG